MIDQYMVVFEVPTILTSEFLSLIPEQQEMSNRLMSEHRITSYTLALDRSKLWVVVNASKETEVEEILDMLPLTDYMDYELHELAFHNSSSLALPPVSLN